MIFMGLMHDRGFASGPNDTQCGDGFLLFWCFGIYYDMTIVLWRMMRHAAG